ncbi:unnamed protein product [Adineta steineri]|uniref:Uncharacterized protein n=1 Tax=Adineta steineri TaxID=433720 RepID=A0A819KWD1_9BILA|nr:unnamed protein product [Adineta steineri]CAF3953158.1 unnamed protein product [Adineta steineri]
MISMVLVAYWLCLATVFGIAAPNGPLKSHITGGLKGIQMRNSGSDLDCNQFTSDYDVLFHFSFLIMINPINTNWQKSVAKTNEDGTLVIELSLRSEDSVPLSIFCLKNLRDLTIYNTSFPSGIVPDNLENLEQLTSLNFYMSPIVYMTKYLGTLKNLYNLSLRSCSLTDLPDLSGLLKLSSLILNDNQLSQIHGVPNIPHLELVTNLFTEIPIMKNPDSLRILSMNNNPLKNILTITSHINLYILNLGHVRLSSVPPTIGKLKELETLDLSNNALFYLPTNMFQLTKLKTLYIHNNMFSVDDTQTFQNQFSSFLPNMTLIS